MTVHNPLFSIGKLLRNKLMQRFYWSIEKEEIALHQYCIELEFKKTQACHGMGHLIIYLIWRSAI